MELEDKGIVVSSGVSPDNVEKLKLFKNTRGHNWEIQIIKNDKKTKEQLMKEWEQTIQIMKELNSKMESTFGNEKLL